jgi:hypothetical protein
LINRGVAGRGCLAAEATPNAAARVLIALLGAPLLSRAAEAVRTIGRLPIQLTWDGEPNAAGLVLSPALASDVPIPKGTGPTWAFVGEHFENLLTHLIAHADALPLPVQEVIVTRDLTDPAAMVLLADTQSGEVTALVCAKDGAGYRLSKKPLAVRASIPGSVLREINAWLDKDAAAPPEQAASRQFSPPVALSVAGGA